MDLIEEWMKAGYVYEGVYNPTNTGTPQGGVLSPLLYNIIGLHGLETMVKSFNNKLGIIRYADDFIISSKTKRELEEIVPRVKQWLLERGLELSTEKTKLVHIDEGFNFLGFNARYYNGKLLIKPQKEKVLAFCKRIGETIKKMATVKQEVIIKKLNPILRGFANYYQGGGSPEEAQSECAPSPLRLPICIPTISRLSWLIANQIHCLFPFFPTNDQASSHSNVSRPFFDDLYLPDAAPGHIFRSRTAVARVLKPSLLWQCQPLIAALVTSHPLLWQCQPLIAALVTSHQSGLWWYH